MALDVLTFRSGVAALAKGGLLGGDPQMASLLGVLALFVGVPAVLALLFMLPRKGQRILFAIMVVLNCYIQKPLYQEVMYHEYRGTDRGFGVTVPDLIFFGFFLFMLLGGDRRKRVWWPYNTTGWLAVILVSCASILVSPEPLYGLFTIHKFLRCLVLYWVTVNFIRDRDDVMCVLNALIVTVLWQGGAVFWAKYVTGEIEHRSVGTFSHPNGLGMYLNTILPVILAALLTVRPSYKQAAFSILAILAGVICVLFTKSRAAIALAPAALGAVTAGMFLMRPT